ncbi:19104_t:CDS:2, partial [Gigaspora margarita]
MNNIHKMQESTMDNIEKEGAQMDLAEEESLPLQNNIQPQYHNNMILVNIINQLQPHINHRQNFHHNNFSTHQNNQSQFNDPSIEQLGNVFHQLNINENSSNHINHVIEHKNKIMNNQNHEDYDKNQSYQEIVNPNCTIAHVN